MWQTQNQLAKIAMMDGDMEQAARHWQSCVIDIKKSQVQESREVGEIFYYFAKTLSALEQYDEALPHWKTSVRIIESNDPNHNLLGTMRQGMTQLFDKVNRLTGESGVPQLALRRPLEARPDYIPLHVAVAELKGCKLAKELHGPVLEAARSYMQVERASNNQRLGGMLLHYYATDPQRWWQRWLEDGLFLSPYKDFEFLEVVKVLSRLVGNSNLLVPMEWKGNCAKGEPLLVRFERADGQTMYLSTTNVVGVVDKFSQALAALGDNRRFYSLKCQGDLGDFYIVYLLDHKKFKYLKNSGVLFFNDLKLPYGN